MGPSQSKLAEALNRLVGPRGVAVTETPTDILIYQLNGADAVRIYDLLVEAGWTRILCEDEGGEIPRHQLAQNGGGLKMTSKRPEVPSGVEAVLTRTAFEALLDRDPVSPIVWVEGLELAIETRAVRYCPWWDEVGFKPDDGPGNVNKVNRVLGGRGPGSNLGRWLLRTPGMLLQGGKITPWYDRAASRLLSAMAQEIEPDDRLLFKGPPSVRFYIENLEHLPADRFAAVQSVAGWLLENERELENRHGLLAAEISRIAVRDGNAMDLAGVLAPAFQGARIAYNFGVTQQSKDTLKALGDLRKAISDDTAKLSETMRTLGAAIVGAVFANVGLIIAKLTLPPNGKFVGPAAVLIGAVLAVYVASVIGGGFHYIWVQGYLRNEWRNSLYKFLSDDDYTRLVEIPIGRAERAFWWMAIAGIIMVVVSLFAVYQIAAA